MIFPQENTTTTTTRNTSLTCSSRDEENQVHNHDYTPTISSPSFEPVAAVIVESGDNVAPTNSAIMNDTHGSEDDDDGSGGEASIAKTDLVDDIPYQNHASQQQLYPQIPNHRHYNKRCIIVWCLMSVVMILMLVALFLVVDRRISGRSVGWSRSNVFSCNSNRNNNGQKNTQSDHSNSSLGSPTEDPAATNITTNDTVVQISRLSITSQPYTNTSDIANNTLSPPNATNEQLLEGDDLFAPNATQWPHLVGMDGNEAKVQLEIHYPDRYRIYIHTDDEAVTNDFCTCRIRIFVYRETNIVFRTPMVG